MGRFIKLAAIGFLVTTAAGAQSDKGAKRCSECAKDSAVTVRFRVRAPERVDDARHAMAAAMAQVHAAEGESALRRSVRRFPGWIGITLDAPAAVKVRDGDVVWRFFEHPEIVSVDPGSPAARAGIRQRDVLIAYDGRDVRSEIVMNRLLQPGRTLHVRVRTREDAEVRDVPVTVVAQEARPLRDRGPDVPGPVMPRSPRTLDDVTFILPDVDPLLLDGPAIAAAPLLAIGRIHGLAGARVETISRGLGEAIGVARGVLVISVPRGSPAHESGLIDGDVIVRADGRAVESVHDLRKLVAGSGERSVRLDVARRGKHRSVTLRW